ASANNGGSVAEVSRNSVHGRSASSNNRCQETGLLRGGSSDESAATCSESNLPRPSSRTKAAPGANGANRALVAFNKSGRGKRGSPCRYQNQTAGNSPLVIFCQAAAISG